MANIQIVFAFPLDQFEISESETVEIYQSNSLLTSCILSQVIIIEVLDLISELDFILYLGETTSRFSLLILPLLVDSEFEIKLVKDAKLGLIPSKDTLSEEMVSVKIKLLHSISICESPKLANTTSAAKPYSPTELLGLSFMEKDLKGQAKFLEILMTGLNSKLVLQEIRQINDEIVEDGQGEGKNLNINGLIEEFENRFKDIVGNQTISDRDQTSSLKSQIEELRTKNFQLEINSQKSSQDLLFLQEEHSRCLKSENNFTQLQSQLDTLKDSYCTQLKLNDDLKSQIHSLLINYEDSIKSFESFKLEADDSFSSLQNLLNTKDIDLNRLYFENSSLKSDLSKIMCELESLKAEIKINEQQELVSSHSTQKNLTLANVVENRSKIEDQKEQINILIEKLKESEKKVIELEDSLHSQGDVIKLVSVNTLVQGTLDKLGNNEGFMEEYLNILHEIQTIKEIGDEFERKFYRLSMAYFEKVNKLSELNLNLHRLFAKYFSLMYDKDCQIYMLRHIARDAQMQRQLYVPVKSDPIDVCMAEYINNRKTPLQIPFIREDQGIYNFYTRTIKVKIENNRVIVRLGGGFQGIDEFINTNTQAELDKLEERRKFGTAEAVKKLIESDFQILGLPAPIDHLTPVVSNETSFSSNPNNSSLVDNISPKGSKRGSFFKEPPRLQKKKTMN